ncbi:hypothetical protein EJ110_NYTH19324 [Nymphaea thermarum]|nr:hypothetical protein EJ110_NYTH19324 [Nymphaea thermarum]
MNAVVQEPDEESQALTIAAPARMNPLQWVSTLRQPPKDTTLSPGLLYVEVRLNEVPTHALVDTGATHNFVASRLVEHFGLVVKPNASHVKAINAVPSATDGEAKFVRTEVGPWLAWHAMAVPPKFEFKLRCHGHPAELFKHSRGLPSLDGHLSTTVAARGNGWPRAL